jgi:hypothetical protein
MSPEKRQETAETADTDGPGQVIADTDAHRIRRRREEAAALNAILSKLRCRHCGSTGCWAVVSSPAPENEEPRVRYARCTACSPPDNKDFEARLAKIVLPV